MMNQRNKNPTKNLPGLKVGRHKLCMEACQNTCGSFLKPSQRVTMRMFCTSQLTHSLSHGGFIERLKLRRAARFSFTKRYDSNYWPFL